jgi:16S rRNA (cytosine967-C5)-methyltransferase
VPHLPDLFAIRWAMDWGPAVAEAAAASLAEEPATDLTLRDASETAKWAEALGGVSLLPGHVRVPRGKVLGPLTEWPGFAEGAWWVQDLAASLPVRLLGAQAGESVLDMCAAPGGKTLQLAALGADVTALDVSDARLERVAENLTRIGLAATLATGDALRWEPARLFDHILLDAPCSATGIFRRHPDVLHLKGARDLTPLTLLQAALLRRAANWLKPGGTLVYATCSLDPREGERIAERVVATVPRQPFEAGEPPLGLQPTADGWLRTLPGMLTPGGGMDSFFIGRFRKI